MPARPTLTPSLTTSALNAQLALLDEIFGERLNRVDSPAQLESLEQQLRSIIVSANGALETVKLLRSRA